MHTLGLTMLMHIHTTNIVYTEILKNSSLTILQVLNIIALKIKIKLFLMYNSVYTCKPSIYIENVFQYEYLNTKFYKTFNNKLIWIFLLENIHFWPKEYN